MPRPFREAEGRASRSMVAEAHGDEAALDDPSNAPGSDATVSRARASTRSKSRRTCCSQRKCVAARSRPAVRIWARRDVSAANRWICWARSSGLRGLKYTAACPQISRLVGVSAATIGRPAAIASTIG